MVARRRIIRAGCGRSTNNDWYGWRCSLICVIGCVQQDVCVLWWREREMRVVRVLESECTWRLCACAVPLRTGEEQVRVREGAVAARCVWLTVGGGVETGRAHA